MDRYRSKLKGSWGRMDRNHNLQGGNTIRNEGSREMGTRKRVGFFTKVLFGLMVLCFAVLGQQQDVKAELTNSDTIIFNDFDVSSRKIKVTATLAANGGGASADTSEYRFDIKRSDGQQLATTNITRGNETVIRTLELEITDTNINTLFPVESNGNATYIEHTFLASLTSTTNGESDKKDATPFTLVYYKVSVSSNNSENGTVTIPSASGTSAWGFAGETVGISATPVSTADKESAFVNWTGATFTDNKTTSNKAVDTITISSSGNTALATFAPITIGGNRYISSGTTSTFSVDSPSATDGYKDIRWSISDASENITSTSLALSSEKGKSVTITPVLSSGTSGSFKLTVTFYDQRTGDQAVGTKTETINVTAPFSITTQPNYESSTAIPNANGYKVMQKSGDNLLLYVPKNDAAYTSVTWTPETSSTNIASMPSGSQSSTTIGSSTYYYAAVKPAGSTGTYKVTAAGSSSTATAVNPVTNYGISDNSAYTEDISLEVAEIIESEDYVPLSGTSIFSVSDKSSLFTASNTVWDAGDYANLTFDPTSKKGAEIKISPNANAKAGDRFTLTATLYDASGTNKVGVLTKSLYIGGSLTVGFSDPYITVGYSASVSATATPPDTITWSSSDKTSGVGSKSTSSSSNASSSVSQIKMKANAGAYNDSSYVTFTAYGNGTSASDSITLFNKPSVSPSIGSSTVTLTGYLPYSVNDGADNDISEVEGGYFTVVYNNSTIASSSVALKEPGESTTATISLSAPTLNSSINNIKSGSSAMVYIYPTDDDEYTKTESKIYGSSSIPVASVVISGTGLTSSTYYGIVGTNVSLTASSSTSPFLYWTDSGASGNTSPTRTITIPSGGTTLTGVAGARSTSTSTSTSSSMGAGGSGGTGGGGYDSVPKTGQGNTFLVVLIAMLACAAFATVFMVKSMRASTEAAGGAGTTSLELSGTAEKEEKKDDWDDV